jgi:hypothetical protein
MLRKAAPFAVLLLVLAVGCGEDEPTQPAGPQPRARQRQDIDVPAGMTMLREDPPLFVTSDPVTIREYVQYLRETGQQVPVRLSEAMVDPRQAARPVSGLTRQQAERYATWAMKRVPTRQEWQMASDVVGPVPYPWPEDGSALAPRVYLVQDWLPGSERAQQARAEREQLSEAILEDKEARLQELRERLQQLAEGQRQRAMEKWQSFKPAFFQLIEKRKQIAELESRKHARTNVLAILEELAVAKGQLAARLTASDADPEKAVQQYEEQLNQWRSQVEQTKQNLEARAQELQQQVVELTREFDQLGPDTIESRYQQTLALIEEHSEPPQDVGEANRMLQQLSAAVERLRDDSAVLEELPSAEALQREAEAVDKGIQEFSPDQETQNKIADLRERIRQMGETIDREFVDEEFLLKNLDDLVEARVRREAVTAALAGLQAVMAQLQEAAPPAAEPEQE